MLSILIALVLTSSRPPIDIHALTDSVFVYTTTKVLNGEPYPSNSMYVVTPAGVVMIDTPWEPSLTAPLLDSIEARHRQPVVLCVVTHSHDDRSAGLDVLRERGIPTWSTPLTKRLAAANGDRQAALTFDDDTTFVVGGTSIDVRFPGEGHTRDNLVVWLPATRVLYGGCLVKSTESPGLGNVADANLSAWPGTIDALIQRYRDARFVVPGHFGWASTKSLAHTRRLLDQASK